MKRSTATTMQRKLVVCTKINRIAPKGPARVDVPTKKPFITVYTDASFAHKSRNIGIGVYWQSHGLDGSCVPPPFAGTLSNPRCRDNNYGELFAILVALHNSPVDVLLSLRTDSLCSLQMIHKRLQKQGSILRKYTPIVDDIIDVALNERIQKTWMSHVRGHATCRGNIIADKLARHAMKHNVLLQPATTLQNKIKPA